MAAGDNPLHQQPTGVIRVAGDGQSAGSKACGLQVMASFSESSCLRPRNQRGDRGARATVSLISTLSFADKSPMNLGRFKV